MKPIIALVLACLPGLSASADLPTPQAGGASASTLNLKLPVAEQGVAERGRHFTCPQHFAQTLGQNEQR